MPFDSFFSSAVQLRKRPLSADYQAVFDKALAKDLKKQPFKPPKRRFDQTTEKQRQAQAISKIEAFL